MGTWDAKHYKEHSKPQEEGGLDALKDFPFAGYERVLDIGCGDGRTTAAIAQKVPHGNVIGIDPSPNMIAACKESYGAVENMSFHQIRAEEFSFDKQFDLIVSFYALHYVENHCAVLHKIYGALKPGGTLIIRMSGGDNQEVAEVFNREPWKSLFAKQENRWHSQHEGDYKKVLYEVGFSDIKIKTVSRYRSMTRKELFDWSFSWVPYVTGLDNEKSIQFTNELINNICKGQDDKKAIKMSSSILYVDAKRPSRG